MILTLIIAGILILLLFLILRFNPVFGSRSTKEKLQILRRSKNFSEKQFINQIPTSMESDAKTNFSMLRDFIKGNPNSKPRKPIEIVPLEFKSPPELHQTRITWFGHSALLMEMEGKTILIDPMFGKAPTPFPWFGNKRYSRKLPFEIDKLPSVDAVILSHDHYDHLDYDSIKKIKSKVKHFFVPLGVGNHLERWGIDPEIISEHDWWEEIKFEGLTLVCTPARHFSGRSLTDRNATLWCSWVFNGKHSKVFFSGDTGYGPHFQEIGEKYGPFDLSLMECGQYDKRWSAIHMMPEQTVQAHLEVKSKTMIPIHWAGFTLSFHDWNDPAERVLQAANERNVPIATPKIGESVLVGSEDYPSKPWWREQ